jgi:hypothetical protein
VCRAGRSGGCARGKMGDGEIKRGRKERQRKEDSGE